MATETVKIATTMPVGTRPNLLDKLALLLTSLLFRQNAVLFLGGLIAGVGSFLYHAIAGRLLGPAAYGQVAFLIAAYGVGATVAVILSLVLARHTATLIDREEQGIGTFPVRIGVLVGTSGVGLVLVVALVAPSIATFEHMGSSTPVRILAVAIALGWQLAVPRGILQGLQRFRLLAVNLALDPIVRVSALWGLVALGLAVSGAVAAVACGLVAALVAGTYSLRDRLGSKKHSGQVALRGAGFPLTAAAGVIGVQLLFNQDVLLAEHYLVGPQGGIYGSLNKIGTIMFYLTLSVSQVLFPRVVAAIARHEQPGRLLLTSAGIVTAIGVAVLLVFAVVPGQVVSVLYGPGFRDATPYVFAVGVIGLALSLDNILVQFFMAANDFWFVPVLAACCSGEAGLIVIFHGSVGQIVNDVLVSLVGLLALLVIRYYFLLPTLSVGTLADLDQPFSSGSCRC
jgi:O-antigen/teichoic acid export membrane protein